MEIAVKFNCDAAFLEYGEYLIPRKIEEGKKLIQKAFDRWYVDFKSDSLSENNYSKLIRASRKLGKMEIADQVTSAKEKIHNKAKTPWYNEENLASDSKIYLPQITE